MNANRNGMCRRGLHPFKPGNLVMLNGAPTCHACDKARKLRHVRASRGPRKRFAPEGCAVGGRFPRLPETPKPTGVRVKPHEPVRSRGRLAKPRRHLGLQWSKPEV